MHPLFQQALRHSRALSRRTQFVFEQAAQVDTSADQGDSDHVTFTKLALGWARTVQ